MSRVEDLTTEQETVILTYAQKWNKIALCTEPINFELAKEAVIKLYELLGLQRPEQIIKISSPLEIINIKVADTQGKFLARLSNKIHNVVYNAVARSVITKVSHVIFNTVSHAVYSMVNNVFYNVLSSTVIHRGANWSGYYAYYSFFRDVLNIKIPEMHNCEEQLALNSTFSVLDKNTTYICDRPRFINTDNTGRLHNTSGPAAHWRDGSKQWFIEGIKVNEQLVMRPETQTIRQIDREFNEELRRIRIERYGWIKYLEHSKAKLINFRINERDNQQEQLYQHYESNRFVCIDPSTGRKYAIAVPHRIRTCLEAQSYLSHGLDEFAIHRS